MEMAGNEIERSLTTGFFQVFVFKLAAGQKERKGRRKKKEKLWLVSKGIDRNLGEKVFAPLLFLFPPLLFEEIDATCEYRANFSLLVVEKKRRQMFCYRFGLEMK